MQTKTSPSLDKSSLLGIRFRRTDVLKSSEMRNHRYQELQKAKFLGSEYDYKVNISFETEKGMITLNTVVWYATEQYAILEDGITVPIQCISRITI